MLDFSLPGLNGLDLEKRVAVKRTGMPIIFITGHGDVPMTVQAMKAGAVEFLDEAIQRGTPGKRHGKTWAFIFTRKEAATKGVVTHERNVLS